MYILHNDEGGFCVAMRIICKVCKICSKLRIVC